GRSSGRSSSGHHHSTGSHSSGSRNASTGSTRSHASPGTGSNPSSTSVRGYTRKDGTYVQSHRRSTADGRFENNYSTQGNRNPYTGKEGSRVTKPKPKPN